MQILGVSAFYHDSAAALIRDGEIIAAAQEERFTRKKHDSGFPKNAIEYCLAEGQTKADEIDVVAFYDKPFLKFERLLETYVGFAPRGFRSFQTAMPVWLKEKLFQRSLLVSELKNASREIDWDKRLLFAEHHLSHAASAFYASPFDDAVVLTLDGVGEWATASVARGRGNQLEILRELHWPHSLGLLYSAFTYYCGFRVNSGEYKLMGLAPYGRPVFKDRILANLMDLKPDGSFRLNLDYFEYCTGLRMTSGKFDSLFDGPARRPKDRLTQHHMDIAASIQAVTEEVMLRMTRSVARETGAKQLCLAGGVALNCVANGKILRDGSFEDIWIQPAAGDAGGAVGAALNAYYGYAANPRHVNGGDSMNGSFLGPAFSQAEVEQRLSAAGARFRVLDEERLLDEVARALAGEKAVGWFQGRMEFGPRALGARSILASPLHASMQARLNEIKDREDFRPVAPVVLEEEASRWFANAGVSPFMLFVYDVLPDKADLIPAVRHVDGTARIQTINRQQNPLYYDLVRAFQVRTGVPVLVNTSFNTRGEPIVCSPRDALECFWTSPLDALVIGTFLLEKP